MTQQAVLQSKEVRFAVVMYGGVSLAIYINGVAQELYNLVRATATRSLADGTLTYLFPDEALKGASNVYRQLGQKLNTRFVVDILSGTSAGGINAVFLAKSLANGETFEQLKDLWIQEGDIERLVNDRESEQGLDGLKVPNTPTSLLNSQRMLYKLLEALDTMKPDLPSRESPAHERSPYVDELDLFVTATDLYGLSQPIRLGTGAPDEYRYKNVFRFRYATGDAAGGKDTNDFKLANSPFLAFAARCTSSFPFAFEPMRLEDVKAVVNTPTFRKKYRYDPDLWKGFYKDYLRPDENFALRSFGDGGYLDNKPFTYATETLLRRRADLPVDRKLIYIEPAPEHPTQKEIEVRPDAIQNVSAALLSLPRYETIREDLQRITDRNTTIERIQTILMQIRHASRAALKKNVEQWQLRGSEWAKLYLDDKVLEWYGPAYAAYQQLRVASVLDEMSSAIVRAIGWEENSAQARAFRRHTLEGWRQAYYRTDPDAKDKRKSENELLFRMDVSWRIRRLQFVQSLIDDLLAGLSETDPGSDQEIQARARAIVADSQENIAAWPFDGNEESRATFRQALLKVKTQFNQAYVELRASGRQVRARNLLASMQHGIEDPNKQVYAESLKALKDGLDGGLDERTIYARLENLSQALASSAAKPKNKGMIREMLGSNSRSCKAILGQTAAQYGMPDSRRIKTALSAIQTCLQFYYDRYEYYDMLTFPLFYGTEVGESDVVEIIRISPEDAPSLGYPAADKLAGTKLGNFGAFFVREWRENDMLWGRLDGAECLINALLPGQENSQARAAFSAAAHQAILQETYLEADRKMLFQSLQTDGIKDADQARTALLRALGGEQKITDHFKQGNTIDKNFPPQTTLNISARASRVTGKLLTGISDKYPALASPAGAIARIGQVFNGLVQFALPKSLPNLLFNYWIWLVYLIELFLALGGKPLGLPDVARLGSMAFAITLAAHLAVLYLQARLKEQLLALRLVHGFIILLVILGAAALIFTVYLGLVYLGFLQTPTGFFKNLIDTLQTLTR